MLAGNRLGGPSAREEERHGPLTEPRFVRWLLLGTALIFLGLFLFVPMLLVFVKAFEDGVGTYLAAIRDPIATAAIRLTLLIASLVVPINLLFGWPRPGPSPSSASVSRTCWSR